MVEYSEGITGVVQLNYYQKIPKRTYDFVFDEAVVEFDYFQNKITLRTELGVEVVEDKGFERNEMFRQQTLAFFKNTQSEKRNTLTQQYLTESDIIIKMCS